MLLDSNELIGDLCIAQEDPITAIWTLLLNLPHPHWGRVYEEEFLITPSDIIRICLPDEICPL